MNAPADRDRDDRDDGPIPCPFCGERLKLEEGYASVQSWRHAAHDWCPVVNFVLPDGDEAVAAWNRRAPADLAALVAERDREVDEVHAAAAVTAKALRDAGAALKECDRFPFLRDHIGKLIAAHDARRAPAPGAPAKGGSE